MAEYIITTPCLFGIESVLKREIQDLGYDIIKVDDGRITYKGDSLAICRSNLWLRTAERVLLNVAEFEAYSFDELFEKIKALPWEKYIPEDGKFWVSKASSIKSKLFSPSDIQSIVKKAIVERLKTVYKVSWFKEDGAHYPMRVFIKKDKVSIGLDSSGDSLHKRGYRFLTSKAPISETLAAALIQLSPWNKDRIFIDPFCGSGTLAIEAAMIGSRMAPGLFRTFNSEDWKNMIPSKEWMKAADEANDLYDEQAKLNIQAYDKDFRILKVARENAKQADVDRFIHFQEREVSRLSSSSKYGVIVTNPPYGERLEDKASIIKLYQEMGKTFKALDKWSYSIITSFEDFERYFGQLANKKRKLYNGMLKTNLYQYLGPKPPRRYN